MGFVMPFVTQASQNYQFLLAHERAELSNLKFKD